MTYTVSSGTLNSGIPYLPCVNPIFNRVVSSTAALVKSVHFTNTARSTHISSYTLYRS